MQEESPDNKVNIGGSEFEIVDEFVYLGVLMRPDEDATPEIRRRIMAASRCILDSYDTLTTSEIEIVI